MTTMHTPPAEPGDPTELDLSVLDGMVGNDAARFRKFALLFLASVGDVLDQLDEAMARVDLDTLAALGHRAKSTSMNVGAVGFARQCLALESAARGHDAATALAIAAGLRPLMQGIRRAIDQRLDPQAPVGPGKAGGD